MPKGFPADGRQLGLGLAAALDAQRARGAEPLDRRGEQRARHPPHAVLVAVLGEVLDRALAVHARQEQPGQHPRQQPHQQNWTGTALAYRPQGSTLAEGERPAATGG